MSKIACRCIECGIINVFDKGFVDGERCLKCGGFISPIGEAEVKSRHERVLKLKIDLDDSQLDKVLEKIKSIKTNMEEENEFLMPILRCNSRKIISNKINDKENKGAEESM